MQTGSGGPPSLDSFAQSLASYLLSYHRLETDLWAAKCAPDKDATTNCAVDSIVAISQEATDSAKTQKLVADLNNLSSALAQFSVIRQFGGSEYNLRAREPD